MKNQSRSKINAINSSRGEEDYAKAVLGEEVDLLPTARMRGRKKSDDALENSTSWKKTTKASAKETRENRAPPGATKHLETSRA